MPWPITHSCLFITSTALCCFRFVVFPHSRSPRPSQSPLRSSQPGPRRRHALPSLPACAALYRPGPPSLRPRSWHPPPTRRSSTPPTAGGAACSPPPTPRTAASGPQRSLAALRLRLIYICSFFLCPTVDFILPLRKCSPTAHKIVVDCGDGVLCFALLTSPVRQQSFMTCTLRSHDCLNYAPPHQPEPLSTSSTRTPPRLLSLSPPLPVNPSPQTPTAHFAPSQLHAFY